MGSEDGWAEEGQSPIWCRWRQHALISQVWDVQFYGDLLKREELSLDDEKLKEFFPLEGTIDRILEVYSEFLGLSFERDPGLPTWHDEVVAFAVHKGGVLVGHLYLDQFPRDGKFGHQMIVPLAPAFTDGASGQVCRPLPLVANKERRFSCWWLSTAQTSL